MVRKKCPGVITDKSFQSLETATKGLEFQHESMWAIKVRNSSYVKIHTIISQRFFNYYPNFLYAIYRAILFHNDFSKTLYCFQIYVTYNFPIFF